MEDLKIPKFESDVPPQLLKDASPLETYVVNHISTLRKQSEWLIEQISEHHKTQAKHAEYIEMRKKVDVFMGAGIIAWLVSAGKLTLESIISFLKPH
jgi:hypothetical protein